MKKYKKVNKGQVVKIERTSEQVEKENEELAKKLDYATKKEMIAAIKKIAKKVGVEVSFTLDKEKITERTKQ